MNIRIVETIGEFRADLGLVAEGVLLEDDLDQIDTDCDLNGRKRRDAEVLCTLAANASGPCLDLGTSHGQSAFKLATNLLDRGRVYTVNILPEQHDRRSGELITHLLTKEQIGAFFRTRGVTGIEQIYADTTKWVMPPELRELAVVFVDAAHDTENVLADSRKIVSRVRDGGFIVWHDFNPELRQRHNWIDAVMRGVELFFAELGLEPEILHLRHSWMGVWRVGAGQSRPEVSRVSAPASVPSCTPIPAVKAETAPRDVPHAMRRLRYAMVYPAYSFGRVAEEAGLAARLSNLGYSVEAIGIPCHGGWWPFPLLDQKWRARNADLMSRYGALADKLQGKDVLIACGGSMIHPEFLRQLDTFNVFLCADDPESSAILSQPVAAAFDFCCVANIACVGDYARWGVRHAAWLPLPVAANLVDYTITEERLRTATRDVDLVMCCERIYGASDRAQRLERLHREFPQAILRGKGWPGGYISDAALLSLYRRARIGWNLHNSIGPVNSRLMMLPAFGVMQICDCRDNLGKVFKLGEEVIGFDTMEECVDATRYYLAHEDERRRIAIAGWKRVLADYTEEKWWRRLLGHIAPHLPRSDSPGSARARAGRPRPDTSRITPRTTTCLVN